MNLNKVLVYASNGGADTNQYGIFRNEVRIPLNIGFGLSEIGYNVNIINGLFDDKTISPVNVENGGNIILSNNPVEKHYNYVLSWNWYNLSDDISYDRIVCLVNYPKEARDAIVFTKDGSKKLTDRKLVIATPYYHLTNHIDQNDGFGTKHLNGAKLKTEFLPPLNPIPCYKLGFSDYCYDINKIKESGWIKIYVYVNSWDKGSSGLTEYYAILEDIKKKTGLKMKLIIQLNSPESIEYLNDISNITKLGDDIEYVYKMRYNELLDLISKIDIFLIRGTPFMASAGIYDIISMGKPMFYISENMDGTLFRNPMFKYKEEIVFIGSRRETIDKMTTNFLNNPSISYNKFKDSMKDSDFKNWGEHARKIFDLSN